MVQDLVPFVLLEFLQEIKYPYTIFVIIVVNIAVQKMLRKRSAAHANTQNLRTSLDEYS
jgi:hypothetical protein